MLKSARRTLAMIALTTLVGCNAYLTPATPPTSVPTPLRINTTSTTTPLMDVLSQAYGEQHPGSTFDTTSANHATLLRRLSADPSMYFLSNHLPQNQPVWAAPIAQDGLAIIVHPGNTVRSLTLEQLRRIYRGYITNWQDVGGSDLNVTVFSRDAGTDIRAEFERLVMGQERTTPNAQLLPSTDAVLAQVMDNPGGIGYVPLSHIRGEVALLVIDGTEPSLSSVAQNVYPLRTVIYIVGTKEPMGTYRDFVGWVQGTAGQASFAGLFAPLP